MKGANAVVLANIPTDCFPCTEKPALYVSSTLQKGPYFFFSIFSQNFIFKVLKAEKLKDEPLFRFQFKASPSNGIYEARMVMNNNGTFRLASRVNNFSICLVQIQHPVIGVARCSLEQIMPFRRDF